MQEEHDFTDFDPLSELGDEANGLGSKDVVHVRVQQRNGRKSWTTIQGLDHHLDGPKIEKLKKHFKKNFCCNGTIVTHREWGEVIQLQGDHRSKVVEFLVDEHIIPSDLVKAIEALKQGWLKPDLAIGGPVQFDVKQEFLMNPLELDLLVTIRCDAKDAPLFVDAIAKTLPYSSVINCSWDEELGHRLREIPLNKFADEEKAKDFGHLKEEDYVFQ